MWQCECGGRARLWFKALVRKLLKTNIKMEMNIISPFLQPLLSTCTGLEQEKRWGHILRSVGGLDYHCRLEEKDRETLMGGLEVEANNVMDPFSPFPSWNRFLLVALCGWRRWHLQVSLGANIILTIVIGHEYSKQVLNHEDDEAGNNINLKIAKYLFFGITSIWWVVSPFHASNLAYLITNTVVVST
jgi:hypothetical protein